MDDTRGLWDVSRETFGDGCVRKSCRLRPNSATYWCRELQLKERQNRPGQTPIDPVVYRASLLPPVVVLAIPPGTIKPDLQTMAQPHRCGFIHIRLDFSLLIFQTSLPEHINRNRGRQSSVPSTEASPQRGINNEEQQRRHLVTRSVPIFMWNYGSPANFCSY